MKILWLSVDRSNRTSPYIFYGLFEEVSKLATVTPVFRKFDGIEMGELCKKVCLENYELNKIIDVDEANTYDLVFTDSIFAYMSEDWVNIKTKKAVLMEDTHGAMVKYYMGSAYHAFDFDGYFVRYKYPSKLRHNYINVDKKMMWLPHSIKPEIFNDYKEDKTINILCIGRIGAKVYPLRDEMNNVLKYRKDYMKVNRPADKRPVKWPIKEEYAKLINKSKIITTCTSKFDHVLMKHFEIPACRSVMMTDNIPELQELGFKPNEHFIETNLGQDHNNIINHWLKNETKLDKVASNGFNLVHEKHTTKERAKDFMNHVLSFI